MKKRSNKEGSFKKLPSGKWSYQVMVGYNAEGKRKIKTFTAPTKQEAKDKYQKYLVELEAGERKARSIGFSEWADTWYADHKSQVEASTYWSYSFTLKLNKHEKGQTYHGLSKLLLNNNIWDATQMKDAIVYDMCRFIGLPAPLTNYARVTLNGKLFGYYLMVEPVDKNFCYRNWPDEVSNIYKPYHNLAYSGEDMKGYADIADFAKVKGGEASMQRVVAALKSVHEGKNLEKHIDLGSMVKYMALQTIVVNFDCMTGRNTQNYYLREADGKISLIPWDYNLAWGGYPEDENMEGEDMLEGQGEPMLPENAGMRSKEEVSRVVNFPIDTPFSADLSERTFFMKLLANEQFKARYYHYLDMLCNQYILGGEFGKTLSLINEEIGQLAGTEANAFYNNDRFHKAQQTFRLMLERRASSVLGQIKGSIPSTWEGQKAQPQQLINSDDINLQDLGGI